MIAEGKTEIKQSESGQVLCSLTRFRSVDRYHSPSPLGESTVRAFEEPRRSCEPQPFLPFRGSVPLKRIEFEPLLCPLLTSVPRSADLAISSVEARTQALASTRHRPPEVSLTIFHAQPPNLQSRSLMDLDFAINGWLVRPRLPRIRFLFIGSRIRSTLPSDPASRRRPCASLSFASIRLERGLPPRKLSNMLGTP